MLRPCTKEAFLAHFDDFYALATDPTRSGYPTYCDGVKTKQMFLDASMSAFERETDRMLLFEQNGAVKGCIHYYWLPEDNYLSTSSFLIAEDIATAMEEFLRFIGENFSGYGVFLGFPAENTAAVRCLAENGFECIENDYNNTAFLDTCTVGEIAPDIVKISAENYADFRVLHDRIEGEMYWNSDRILADFENWSVFVKRRDDTPIGAVYCTDAKDGWYEIFGIDLKDDVYDPSVFVELLNAALAQAKERGGKVMTFFCEEEQRDAVKAAGFSCVGQYLCYQKHI